MTPTPEFNPPLRVMVVDDSPIARRLLVRVLSRSGDITIAAELDDGLGALATARSERIDVLVLDLDMPEQDGRTVLRELAAAKAKFGVVVYTGAVESELGDIKGIAGQELACEILSKGSDAGGGVQRLTQDLIPLVRKLGGDVRSSRGGASAPAPSTSVPKGPAVREETAAPPPKARAPRTAAQRIGLVVIGASTGGPDALQRVIEELPKDFPVPIAIVQHMPIGFTAQLASRLNERCDIEVREAVDGERLVAEQILIAPGGVHLEVQRAGAQLVTRLTDAEPENSCRPAVDVLFRTAASALPGSILAVVLTGMGQDGLVGVEAIRSTGGSSLVQNQATSVVWGMPGAVAKAGQADEILPLEGVASRLVNLVNVGRSERRAG